MNTMLRFALLASSVASATAFAALGNGIKKWVKHSRSGSGSGHHSHGSSPDATATTVEPTKPSGKGGKGAVTAPSANPYVVKAHTQCATHHRVHKWPVKKGKYAAERSCMNEAHCIGVYDVSCTTKGPFYLCGTSNTSTAAPVATEIYTTAARGCVYHKSEKYAQDKAAGLKALYMANHKHKGSGGSGGTHKWSGYGTGKGSGGTHTWGSRTHHPTKAGKGAKGGKGSSGHRWSGHTHKPTTAGGKGGKGGVTGSADAGAPIISAPSGGKGGQDTTV